MRRIKMLGSAGATLETIQPCVANDDPTFKPCNLLRRILAQQIVLIDERTERRSHA